MEEIANLKEYLSNKIGELKKEIFDSQKELELLTNVMKKVDSLLIQNSFTPAKELYNQIMESKVQSVDEKPSPPQKQEKTIIEIEPIKFEETVLATVKSSDRFIIFTLSDNLKMTAEEPPFRSFIMNKFKKELEEEDINLIQNNKIREKEKIAISYQRNNSNLVEKISVLNYRTEKRKENIIKAVSWSLRTIFQGK